MKRLLLLIAIFLTGCIDAEIELNTKSPEKTPTETVSLYVDNFNSANVKALNETTASPFFWLLGEEKRGTDCPRACSLVQIILPEKIPQQPSLSLQKEF